MPVKLPNLPMKFGTQMGQESATALVQMFGKRITKGQVFLWAASLHSFKLK